MREGKKGNRSTARHHRLHIGFDEGKLAAWELGKPGEYLLDPSSGIAAGRGGGDLRCGMAQKEPEELHPGVPAGAQDGDLGGFHGERVDMAGKSRLANDECGGLHSARLPAPSKSANIGTWRSLVARLTGGEEVAGSNPVVPTIWVLEERERSGPLQAVKGDPGRGRSLVARA